MTLGLAIGANTAFFSVVDAVLIRPLDFPRPDRLVVIWEEDRLRGTVEEYPSLPDYFDLREQSTAFASLGAYTEVHAVLTDPDAPPERLAGSAVTHTLLQTLGRGPILGRPFTAAGDLPGREPTVLLSHGLWLRRFGADSAVIGRKLVLDDQSAIIVGVMPPGFDFPSPSTQYWMALAAGPNTFPRRNHSYPVVARLAPEASLATANAELSAIMRRLEDRYPETNAGRGARAQPLLDMYVGELRVALGVLQAAVLFVLLIACANVANLLLARSAAREREVAIRSALGSGRGRLFSLFLAESVILAVLGGALGAALASFAIDALLTLGGADLPRAGSVAIDGRALAFTALTALAVGLLFGLAPALQASRTDLPARIREGASGSGYGPNRQRVRRALVVSEVALAVMLFIGAALLLKSYWRLQTIDPGFNSENVVILDLQLPESRYSEEAAPGFVRLLRRSLVDLPDVKAVDIALHHPLRPGWRVPFTHDDGRGSLDEERLEARLRPITPSYFATIGAQILAGRAFTERDREDAPAALIINDAMARRFFPRGDAIGRHVTFWGESREIVGIVSDVRFRGIHLLGHPAMYPPLYQVPFLDLSVLIKTSTPTSTIIPAARARIARLDADLPLFNIRSLDQLLWESVSRRRFNMVLLVTFAAVALILAAVGIYGIVAYSVSQRSREIGIRMALGADRRGIIDWVVAQGIRLALIGIVIGVGAALITMRALSSLLYGVSPTDLATFIAVPLTFSLLAVFASYIPARRASRLDPVDTLRAD